MVCVYSLQQKSLASYNLTFKFGILLSILQGWQPSLLGLSASNILARSVSPLSQISCYLLYNTGAPRQTSSEPMYRFCAVIWGVHLTFYGSAVRGQDWLGHCSQENILALATREDGRPKGVRCGTTVTVPQSHAPLQDVQRFFKKRERYQGLRVTNDNICSQVISVTHPTCRRCPPSFSSISQRRRGSSTASLKPLIIRFAFLRHDNYFKQR